MSVPAYSKQLPGPLQRVRSRLIRRAWRVDPASRTETWEVDGLSVVLDPAFPTPVARLGWEGQAFVGRHHGARPGERVLDLAAGSGLVGLFAARQGADVVVVDPAEPALRCVRRSFILAGLPDPELVCGDSPSAAGEGPFDLVTWTAPFLAGEPTDAREARVVRGPDSRTEDVLTAARDRLGRGGRLIFAWPDQDATPWLHRMLADVGFRYATVVYERHPVLGPVRLYRAWMPRHGEQPGEPGAGEALPGAEWVLKDR